MTNRIWTRHTVVLAATVTSLATAPLAQAAPPPGTPAAAGGKPSKSGAGPVDTASCTPPVLSQPFASSDDSHWYTLMPGEIPDNLVGSGWKLTGGAKIVATRLADGRTGSVLDLPTGATAITPTICVTSAYPAARMVMRELIGSGGVAVSIGMAGTRTWSKPQSSGQRHGRLGAWKLTSRINLHPAKTPGWHLMRIKLVARGHKSEFQLYNLYIDPRLVG